MRGIASLSAVCALALLDCSSNGIPDSHSEAAVASESQAVSTAYDWLQFYGDARHTGNNTLETQITAANVSGLQRLFQIALPTVVDGTPVILTGVTTGSGVRDLVFVNTMLGQLIALDAHTGATIWSKQPAGTSYFTNSSPAIDPGRAFVYAYGLDGFVRKYAVGTGVETTTGGWPEQITLKPTIEKGGPNLAIATVGATSYLYMGNSGYGDGGDYQGHLTTINLSTGTQKVFNALCSNQAVHFTTGSCATKQAGIWNRGVVYDSDTARIYSVTGNGNYAPASFSWGDTVLALNPDGSGVNSGPVDSYTPAIFQSLQDSDLDLGSVAPAILPGSGTKYPHIGVQGGKDAKLRIINLDNLSGQGAPGHTGGELFTLSLPQAGEVANGTPTWVNPADQSTWLFVVGNTDDVVPGGLAAFKLTLDASGNPSLVTQWTKIPVAGAPFIKGAGLLVANNVLYYATNSGIVALNPTTGAQLWSDSNISATHWQSPVVANGILYMTDKSGQLTAYSLSPGLSALPRSSWVVSASLNSATASQAIDNNLGTRWVTGQAQKPGQTFTVNMGAKAFFSQIALDAGTFNGDYPHGYQVAVSNDGATWGASIASAVGTTQLITVSFAQQNAQYIRITQTGTASNWWSLAELNVYGPASFAAPLSRAGWVASAFHTDGNSPIAGAIDSDPDLDTRWSSGVPQANGTGTAQQWFQVDLGSRQTFRQLNIDSADNLGDYTHGYQVFVSNDGATWGNAIASGSNGSAMLKIQFAAQTAQYVRVVQTGTSTSWWSIVNFNVLN